MAASVLRLDLTDVYAQIAALKRRAKPAIARALNRSANSAKTIMVREIAKDLGIKQKNVKESVVVRNAAPDHLTATFYASARRIPLMDFRAKGPNPSRGKGRGVTARLPGGVGRYPNAFIATMGSGHSGVFRRMRQSRLPIQELHGPSIARVFNKHVNTGLARAREQLIKNLRSELAYAASRSAAA